MESTRGPEVHIERDFITDDTVLSLRTTLSCSRQAESSMLTEARAALLDAKVQVEERVALGRYRAFVERVAGLVGRDVVHVRDDLTGYQLDAIVSALQSHIHPPSRPTQETTMATPLDCPNVIKITQPESTPSAYQTAKTALLDGMKRGAVTVLVLSVRKPVVRLISKSLGKPAGQKAERWLQTPTGEAVFSVAVGGVGLGAQALGLTGKFTDKVNKLCGEAITQGIHGGAKAVLMGALGEVFAAYTEAAAKIDAATDDDSTTG